MLRLLLGSDTSCCDLLQSGLPRIPTLPHPDKPCSYQDDQAQSHASGRPGLYNACCLPRCSSPPRLDNAAFASLCASLCVARDLGWCEYDYPRWGGHTPAHRLLSWGRSSYRPPLGAPTLRFAPPRCPKPSPNHSACVSLVSAYTNNLRMALLLTGCDLIVAGGPGAIGLGLWAFLC
jgi:hypothetical protein